jgi:hypothetical protein
MRNRAIDYAGALRDVRGVFVYCNKVSCAAASAHLITCGKGQQNYLMRIMILANCQ